MSCAQDHKVDVRGIKVDVRSTNVDVRGIKVDVRGTKDVYVLRRGQHTGHPRVSPAKPDPRMPVATGLDTMEGSGRTTSAF